MPHFVYILHGKLGKATKLYVGKTDNIERRMQEHLAGKSNYTSKLKHIKLIFYMTCKDAGEQSSKEKELKHLSPKKKKALVGSSLNLLA